MRHDEERSSDEELAPTVRARGGGLRGTARSMLGQSTVEYALVLLGAAAIALLVVSWVTGTDVIGRLFDAVFGRIIDQAT